MSRESLHAKLTDTKLTVLADALKVAEREVIEHVIDTRETARGFFCSILFRFDERLQKH